MLGAVVVLLGAGTAFALAGPIRDHGDGGATRRTTTTTSTAPPVTGVAAPACRTPLSPADPLRLWIGGDSLAGSLGPSLGDLAGRTGVVQPVVDSRVSSGLVARNFLDWPVHSGRDMSLYDPEVIVFIIGANDAKNIDNGTENDPTWRAQYAALVEEMLTALRGNGRTVYWVGAPVMADAAYSERVQGVNDVFREVAAQHQDVTYVDAYSLFSGPDGSFASTLPVPGRGETRVRADDGIHFTPDGGDLLAQRVFERLDSACRVTRQAVRGVTKPTIEAQGSTSVPGTRRGPTASSARPGG
ncbi:MAG TPA: DUF459 domain-containing protein [Acidimicrobiia bacterium]|nr:DUF459 domain-containing protein [Acidimicrobiia bacterium]